MKSGRQGDDASVLAAVNPARSDEDHKAEIARIDRSDEEEHVTWFDELVTGTVSRADERGLLIGNTAEQVLRTVSCSRGFVSPGYGR